MNPAALWVAAMVVASFLAAIAEGGEAGGLPRAQLRAQPWPDAERLFRGDERWRGADGAHSVVLGNGRILWLFGDTLIDPRAEGRRRGAVMIRNSIGIQTGTDPSTAGIRFYWNARAEGRPSAFFKAPGEVWYWPGDGIRIQSRLLIWLMAVKRDPNPLGFALIGWRAVLVDRPDAPPTQWRLVHARTGSARFDIILGAGGVLVVDDFVYAFGGDASGRRAYLARWPVSEAVRGDLARRQWWCGPEHGWTPERHVRWFPMPLFDEAQYEFGVYRDAHMGVYVQIQSIGFGAADLGFRTAAHLEGPWTTLVPFFRPEEYGIPGVLIYAAKPHDGFAGGCAVTYATNHSAPQRLVDMPSLYYPRVLRVGWRGGPPTAASRREVVPKRSVCRRPREPLSTPDGCGRPIPQADCR